MSSVPGADEKIGRVDSRLIFSRIREDPEWYYRTVLGDDPWELQLEIDRAIHEHSEVVVASCHGAGKSWLAARAVLRWLKSYDKNVVVTTAPTARQVRHVLWREIHRAVKGARVSFGGRLLTTEYFFTEFQQAFGFTSNDYDENKMSGLHDDNILVVVDEGDGISSVVMEGIEGLMASGNASLFMIGNPLNATSPLGRMWRDKTTHKVRISAFDTPNFTTYGVKQEHISDGSWVKMVPKDPTELPRPMLCTPHWVARMYARWGLNSAFYQARVLARFPTQSSDALFTSFQLAQAREADLEPEESAKNVLALDVARKGIDENVLVHRKGGRVRVLWFTPQEQRTTWVAQRVIFTFNEMGLSKDDDEIRVDVIGIGAGVVDYLEEQGYPVVGVNFGAAASEKDRFVNARAESYWGVRDYAERGELDLPDDDEVENELAEQRWRPGRGGRIQLIEKADLNIPSPNKADAIALAFSSSEEKPFLFC